MRKYRIMTKKHNKMTLVWSLLMNIMAKQELIKHLLIKSQAMMERSKEYSKVEEKKLSLVMVLGENHTMMVTL